MSKQIVCDKTVRSLYERPILHKRYSIDFSLMLRKSRTIISAQIFAFSRLLVTPTKSVILLLQQLKLVKCILSGRVITVNVIVLHCCENVRSMYWTKITCVTLTKNSTLLDFVLSARKCESTYKHEFLYTRHLYCSY